MWYGRDWAKGGRTPEETLLHEAYHLGADDVIYKTLSNFIKDNKEYQLMKERIVDVCSRQVLVPGVLVDTHIQHKNTPYPIDSFLEQVDQPVPIRLQNYANSLNLTIK